MNYKYFKQIVIYPLSLLILSYFLIILRVFAQDESFRSITLDNTVDASIDQIESNKYKIAFDIMSTDDYFGTIVISDLNSFFTEKSDKVNFKIREKDSEFFINDNEYNAYDLLLQDEFPFGFEIQRESKNKEYVVEIEVNEVFQEGGIQLDTLNIELKYDYSPSYIVKHPDKFISLFIFHLNKLKLNKKMFDFIFILVLPQLLYLYIKIFQKKVNINKLFKSIQLFFSQDKFQLVILGLILFDIILQNNHLFYFSVFIFTIYHLIYKKRENSDYLLFYSILFFFIDTFFLVLKLRYFSDRFALWIFVFLSLYALCLVINIRKETNE